MTKESGIVIFNRNSAAPWQAYEDVRKKNIFEPARDDEFIRAIDVRIGDNIWEHNIVSSIELLAEPVEGIKFHYGSEKEGPELIENQDEIDEYFHCFTCGSDLSEACTCGENDTENNEYIENLIQSVRAVRHPETKKNPEPI